MRPATPSEVTATVSDEVCPEVLVGGTTGAPPLRPLPLPLPAQRLTVWVPLMATLAGTLPEDTGLERPDLSSGAGPWSTGAWSAGDQSLGPPLRAANWQRTSRGPSLTERRETLLRRIRQGLEEAPVEDGLCHPMEAVLGELARLIPEQVRNPQLAYMLKRLDPPPLAAGFLLLMARAGLPTSASSRLECAAFALHDGSVVLRDAGFQAAELWDEPELRSVVQAAVEREQVPWLRDYGARVLKQSLQQG